MPLPIMQFGTSRFLQAHVDLFLGEALARGEALGKIAVVQTTNSVESGLRVEAFNAHATYPVLIRGIENGQAVERQINLASIGRALQAQSQWGEIERLFVDETRYVVSNTGDRGYVLDPRDQFNDQVPRSFPAKLVKLLHLRWINGCSGVTFLPCELTSRNGDALRDIVIDLAQSWELEQNFIEWLQQECLWVNSLVDRIVSEALDPVGAVAEPYALWAIEHQPRLEMFCRHPAIHVVADLRPYERLKLFVLNLGHTYLVDLWLRQGRTGGVTVREALEDPRLSSSLEQVYEQEVLPVFRAIGMGEDAFAYKEATLERFANPFLRHRLSDIAANHEEKKQRRIGGLLELAQSHRVDLPMPLLLQCLNPSSQSPT